MAPPVGAGKQLLPAGLLKAEPCRYCFYSGAQNSLYLPRRGDTCPFGPLPLPNFTFMRAQMWEFSPQNCQNLEFWKYICPSRATRLQYFYEILSIFTRL